MLKVWQHSNTCFLNYSIFILEKCLVVLRSNTFKSGYAFRERERTKKKRNKNPERQTTDAGSEWQAIDEEEILDTVSSPTDSMSLEKEKEQFPKKNIARGLLEMQFWRPWRRDLSRWNEKSKKNRTTNKPHSLIISIDGIHALNSQFVSCFNSINCLFSRI